MTSAMTPIENTNLSVTIGGQAVGGMTSFMVRMGKETVLVPSEQIIGAYVYMIKNVHYLELEREVYNSGSFSNLHNLTNFTVVASWGSRTVRYTGCEIEDIYEYCKNGGRAHEKIKISVGTRTVV